MRLFLIAIGIAAVAQLAAAQVNSIPGTILIRATWPESVTVAINSGGAANFSLAPQTATNISNTTTNFSTSWALKPGRTTLEIWAYFSSARVALQHQTAGNTTDISPAMFKIQVNGSGPYAPVTAINPFNGLPSGLQIGPSIHITGTNKVSSRADTLAYQIDTTLQPQLQADTYVGVLNLQVQVTP